MHPFFGLVGHLNELISQAKIKAAWEGKSHQQVYELIMSENNWDNLEATVHGLNLFEVAGDPKYVSIQPNRWYFS